MIRWLFKIMIIAFIAIVLFQVAFSVLKDMGRQSPALLTLILIVAGVFLYKWVFASKKRR